MPGIGGATHITALASLKRLSSLRNSTTAGIITYRLRQQPSTSISAHSRLLDIPRNKPCREFGLAVSTLSQRRSFSLLSPSRMSSNNNGTTDGIHASNGNLGQRPTTDRNNHSNHNSNGSGDGNNNTTDQVIYFGPFEVTKQVFLKTPCSFALVNLKPLLPGHVLVCPLRPAKRLTDLSVAEITDLFSAVQKVQRMLARYYFSPSTTLSSSSSSSSATTAAIDTGCAGKQGNDGPTTPDTNSLCRLGSFNIAIQDGPEAGQTVSHLHVHVIPRIRGSTAKDAATPSDELYDRMAGEDGNIGGAQWDRQQQQQHQNHRTGVGRRPEPGGQFPSIEDSQRVARGMDEMEAEAETFRRVLREMEMEGC